MTKTQLVLKRKPDPKLIFKEYQEEVRDALKDEFVAAHVRSREEVVADWSDDTRPEFSGIVRIAGDSISVFIRAQEVNPERPIWKWLDETGTPPHEIAPKPDNPTGRLWFEWGGPGSYDSKTKASPARFGGPGVVVGGGLVNFEVVNHPGFEPRNFSEPINKDLEPKGKKTIYNAGRRGMRRAIKKSGRK